MAARLQENFKIPGGINLIILIILFPATWGLLWVASHLSLGWALLAAWAFAFVNHTPFSLLHEAVHNTFSRKSWLNYVGGSLCAATFPTSYTLQKIAHLGHHRRNRTDVELFDYHLPHQSRALRSFLLYSGNLMGFYWVSIPISNLVFVLAPWFYTSSWFRRGPARALGFEPFVADISAYPKLQIWLECVFAFSYQVFIWWALDLSWQGWLLCYWAFALHWSALQYVDHAYSPRDIVNGAWNLKVSRFSCLLALNYHYHLVHHRRPTIPWIYLPSLVDPTEPQPSFWSIYFRLWGGTRPAPPMADGVKS